MKLTIKRTALTNALSVVKGAVSTKATVPILANVHISTNEKSLTLTATDLDITLRTKVEADISDKGDTTVRAALLFDLCRSFTSEDADQIALSLAGLKLKLVAEEADFELAALEGTEFPPTPRIADAQEFDLVEGELHALLHRTAFARGTDDKRLILCGCLLRVAGAVSVVACDGRRLAVEQTKTVVPKLKADLNLPGKAVNELLRLLKSNSEDQVNIKFNANAAQFTFGEHTLITKLIEGEYPDYTRLIPEMTGATLISRPELLAAVKRVNLIADGVRLEFKPTGQVIVRSHHSKNDPLGMGRESIDAQGANEATAHLNCRYLIESLEACNAGEVSVFPSNTAPIAFLNPKTNWVSVIAILKS